MTTKEKKIDGTKETIREELTINGFAVKVVEVFAIWDEAKQSYQHNYPRNRFAGYMDYGTASLSSTCNTIGGAKRSLRAAVTGFNRGGWKGNESFVISATHFVGRGELPNGMGDQTRVSILVNKVE